MLLRFRGFLADLFLLQNRGSRVAQLHEQVTCLPSNHVGRFEQLEVAHVDIIEVDHFPPSREAKRKIRECEEERFARLEGRHFRGEGLDQRQVREKRGNQLENRGKLRRRVEGNRLRLPTEHNPVNPTSRGAAAQNRIRGFRIQKSRQLCPCSRLRTPNSGRARRRRFGGKSA